MKFILVLAVLLLSNKYMIAQTNNKNGQKGATKTSSKATKKNLAADTALQGGKTVPLHHGSHDYTPGSPVGTGGAGGSTMSGSPQGSASENAMGKNPSNELRKKNPGTQ